ncbi:MAG: ABC transporter permease [Gemmatimonadales bacterium]|jgi:spermidine/putrescine transport system permease protein|nr:ABC transporter permease [Gemmatimonadales bacterium]
MRRRLLRWLHDRPTATGWALLTPGALWLALFFGVPLAILLAYGFMPRGTYGGVEPGFTLANYRRLGDPLYLGILWRTVLLSLATTAACLLLGLPTAWAIVRSGRWRGTLLFLAILPFWTSALVRTYATMVLLRDTGLVNGVLKALHLIDRPLHLLYTEGAVLAGLVYGALPFMILPLYASLEKLDPTLLEAAEVLGARPWARVTQVILPLALPGIAAGCLLVFIPTLGSFVVPDLLGGAKAMMVGSLVQNQFGPARDWPFGSAVSFAMMSLVLVAVLAFLRVTGREPEA